MSTILVVDDRAENRALLTTLLGYAKHSLFEAADGATALGIMRSAQPDLVITDIVMPTMDGHEFLRHLRADPAFAAIPVMLYTAAHDRGEAQDLAARYGIEHILVKPCEPEDILRAVAEALGEAPIGPAEHTAVSTASPVAHAERLRVAEDEIERSEAALAAACARANTAPEAGRAAIALELHDHLGQQLSAVKLDLQRFLRAPDAQAFVSPTHALVSRIDAALERVRALSATLRPRPTSGAARIPTGSQDP